MSIAVGCQCGQQFAANAKLAGKRVKCPKCGRPIAIPAAPDANSEPASAPEVAADPLAAPGGAPWGGLPPVGNSPLSPGPSANYPAYPAQPQAYSHPTHAGRTFPWKRWAIFGGGAAGVLLLLAAVGIGAWALLPALRSVPGIDEVVPSSELTQGEGSIPAMDFEPGQVALPNGVVHPPQRLTQNAPFDVVEYFRSPPDDQNAAPLYLEALCEFDSAPTMCLPESEQQMWAERAARRAKKIKGLHVDVLVAPDEVSRDEFLKLLEELQPGFDKIQAAQQRPGCVFHVGLGMSAMLPHDSALDSVAKAYTLKTAHDLEQGDLDAAIANIDSMLRLGRDLRRRGHGSSHLKAASSELIIANHTLHLVLKDSRLTTAHCDRLLEILQQHHAEANLLTEALKGVYVTFRVYLINLEHRSGEFAPDALQQRWEPVLSGKRGTIPKVLAIIGSYNAPVWGPRPDPDDLLRIAEQRYAKMTPADYAHETQWLNSTFSTLTEQAPLPLNRRLPTHARIQQSVMHPRISMLRFSLWGLNLLDKGLAQARTQMGAAICFVAIRRWELEKRRPLPADLAPILAAAGISKVPEDPFAGGSLKLAITDRKLVVYSLGSNGRDDGGESDDEDHAFYR
jgi:hypothetical protein